MPADLGDLLRSPDKTHRAPSCETAHRCHWSEGSVFWLAPTQLLLSHYALSNLNRGIGLGVLLLLSLSQSDRFHGTYPPNFNEGTHPISGGPLGCLSEATNDATLASWRRIQLMAKERTSVRMQAQIKVLSEQGHSIRRIARILRLSRRTVRKFLEPLSKPPPESGGWVEQWTGSMSARRSTAKGLRSSRSSGRWLRRSPM